MARLKGYVETQKENIWEMMVTPEAVKKKEKEKEEENEIQKHHQEYARRD